MRFEDKYTTLERKNKDTAGKETNKIVLSEDAFAIAELMEDIKLALRML